MLPRRSVPTAGPLGGARAGPHNDVQSSAEKITCEVFFAGNDKRILVQLPQIRCNGEQALHGRYASCLRPRLSGSLRSMSNLRNRLIQRRSSARASVCLLEGTQRPLWSILGRTTRLGAASKNLQSVNTRKGVYTCAVHATDRPPTGPYVLHPLLRISPDSPPVPARRRSTLIYCEADWLATEKRTHLRSSSLTT